MKANRGDHVDSDASRSRRTRHHDRDSPRDDFSVDSGYGGSSAATSPQVSPKGFSRQQHLASPKHDRSRSRLKHDADKASEAGWEDSGSDSDYDPKAKYYLAVDDDGYRDISFQGRRPSDESQLGESGERRRDAKREHSVRRRRSDYERRGSRSHRRRSVSSTESESGDLHKRGGCSPRESSHRYSDSPQPRRDSYHRSLSPIPSEQSEGLQTTSGRTRGSSHRSRSRIDRHRKDSSGDSFSDTESTDSQAEDLNPKSRTSLERPRRARTRDGSRRESSRPGRRSGSSSYKGAADMDDAWYKTFKERITKGVDMKQVKKVGLDAAAVAAIKVAVGTQLPWKQRIPKTIAVGLAAAVTDFLISKTSVKPKGMVGTMYARQLVEIALANLIINPVSKKVTGTAQTTKGNGGVRSGGVGRRR